MPCSMDHDEAEEQQTQPPATTTLVLPPPRTPAQLPFVASSEGLLADVCFNAEVYCAMGFDELERFALEHLKLNDQQREQLSQGVRRLYAQTRVELDKNLAAFKEYSRLVTFHVPPVVAATTDTSLADGSIQQQEQQSIDAEAVVVAAKQLQAARCRLQQQRTANDRLRRDANILKQELEANGCVPESSQEVLELLNNASMLQELQDMTAVAKDLSAKLKDAQRLQTKDMANEHAGLAADMVLARRQVLPAGVAVQQMERWLALVQT